MTGSIKTLTKKILSQAGYYQLRCRWRSRSEKKLVALMYHDLVDDSQMTAGDQQLRRKICRSEFDAHMDVVSRNFRVLTLEAAAIEIAERGKLKEDTVSVTFDDGYSSVYNVACPILRKYGVPATVYLATDWINGRMNFWWDRLTAMVEQCRCEGVNCSVIREILGSHPFPQISFDNNVSAKRTLLNALEDTLRDLNEAEQSRIIESLRDRVFSECRDPFVEPAPLSWDEIKRLHKYGMVFGAHTCSHINLSHADLLVAEKEIGGSKREIEHRLGMSVKGFAYPYGQDVSGYARLIPLLEGLGFDYACTASPGINDRQSNLYLLRRHTLPAIGSRALLKRELYLDFCS